MFFFTGDSVVSEGIPDFVSELQVCQDPLSCLHSTKILPSLRDHLSFSYSVFKSSNTQRNISKHITIACKMQSSTTVEVFSAFQQNRNCQWILNSVMIQYPPMALLLEPKGVVVTLCYSQLSKLIIIFIICAVTIH